MVDDGWLNLVRIARDSGDVSSLLPPGVSSMLNAPHVFVEAIRMGLYYLSFDELPVNERPPKYIWLDSDRMAAWWEEVRSNRKSKGRDGGDYQGMPQNELLKDVFKGRGFRG